mgnify:CR=1 FL=1
MDRKIVGERLKILREGIHLSQAKLAEKFGGIDQPSIFRYEKWIELSAISYSNAICGLF